MNLPFTTEQFLGVFEKYNTTVFPLQILFNILAIVVIILIVMRTKFSDKFVGYTLSFFWIWIGVVYQFLFFSEINPAAKFFALIFIMQGILFLYFTAFKEKTTFQYRADIKSVTGSVIIFYALILYPLIGFQLGHIYPRNPTFGLPCPTTIFTFGILLFSVKKVPWYLYLLPSIWALIGFSAAITLGILEDTGLLVSAIIAVTMIILSNKKLMLKAA